MTIATTTINMSTATTWAPKLHPATRSRSDDVKAIPTVLRSEWIKVSSVRASKVLLGSTAAVGGLLAWASATFVTDEVLTVAEVFVFPVVLTAALAAITGILLFSSEAQHGTLATALTAQPARWVIVAAKVTMAAGLGLVFGAIGMVAGFGGAVLGGIDMGDTSAIATTAPWALLFTALATVFGLGIGMIVRHSSGAISGLLVWWLVVENLVTVLAPEKVARFLPFFAGNSMLGIEGEGAFAESPALALSPAQDALIFGGYAAVALLLGTVLLYRRDTN